jgi:hypothetical protein
MKSRLFGTVAARAIPIAAAVLAGALLGGCSDDDHTILPSLTARTYRMGFSWFAPRPDLNLALTTINLWSTRADAALILVSPPWDSLLAGRSPDSLVRNNELGLANYYRARGLRVIVSIDPTNGLDRSSEAPALVAAGRSLAEVPVQELYRDYVTAMDTLIRPDYLGIASETNLVRAIAPGSVYNAVVQAAGMAATQVAIVDSTARLYTTVQVETAWGALGGGGGYVGIDQDLADFGFIAALGLSSYPYLGGYSEPDSIPLNYYSRLQQGKLIQFPMLVIEGGWPSDSVGAVPSDPQKQSRYIARHARIQDQAGTIAWFQITFTDLDEAAYGFPPGQLTPFSMLGLVDVNLTPKPALSTWDGIFTRPRR